VLNAFAELYRIVKNVNSCLIQSVGRW